MTSIDEFEKRCKSQHDKVDAKIDRFSNVIFGNGREGIMTRLVRIEAVVNIAKWALGFCIASFFANITMLLKMVLEH